jgi:outer membrane protein
MFSVKQVVRLAVAATMMMIGPSIFGQAMKIGVITDENIKTKYPPFLRAQEQFETERKAWDKEAQDKSDELNTMIEDYNNQKVVLSDEKKKEREATIRTKKDALDFFTRQIYGPSGTAERKQAELLDPILEKIHQAIQAVAEEESFDIILTSSSGLAYFKPSMDVTDKVLAKLEKLDQ